MSYRRMNSVMTAQVVACDVTECPGTACWHARVRRVLADPDAITVYYAIMKAKVPAALVGLVALMAALLVGCSATTPVPDVVSRTITLESADFALRTPADGQNAVATATYDVPEITAEIVDAGTVTAETDLGSLGATWSALPLTLRFTERTGAARAVEIQTSYREGEFMVVVQADRLQNTVAGMLAVNGYRVRATVISADEAGD